VEAASGLTERHSRAAKSLVYVAVNGRLAGLLAYSDPPRQECAAVLQALRGLGVARIVMLTGDNERAARVVAEELGITDVIADAFPEQKAEVVQSLREQGYVVAVIGDGVNDSPAFTRADVGISLPHGADVAKETADVILLDGSLWGLPRAIDLARSAVGTLNQNLNIIMGPTAAGLVASVFGLMGPLAATVVSNGATVLAGLNALRPLGRRCRHYPPETRLLTAERALR
jgi:P-type Cu2+ transporter